MQTVRTDNNFFYPVFPAHSEAGFIPNDEKALENVNPSEFTFNVGHDPKGNAIQNCIVGIGAVNLHNLYRYNSENKIWRLIAIINHG